MAHELTAELAAKFARIALSHVGREYPGVVQHVMERPGDFAPPSTLHPVFHGSLDWHSCVHGHWLLARLLRAFPDLAQAGAIRARFDLAFTAERVAVEAAYFDRPSGAGFERPYGWAWLLMFAAELERGGPACAAWREALRPLDRRLAEKFAAFLPKADYPVRAGVHSNSAFALILVLDYAGAVGEDALAALAGERALRWYRADAACQAWEPGGDEFLSPALVEAELMRRILPPAEFRLWLARFLPELADGRPAALFEPARVSDRSDGKIAHLDGLNLSRAWCWRAIAAVLDEADPVRDLAAAAADRHLAAGLPHVAGDYMGEHWLASFAVLALTEA